MKLLNLTTMKGRLAGGAGRLMMVAAFCLAVPSVANAEGIIVQGSVRSELPMGDSTPTGMPVGGPETGEGTEPGTIGGDGEPGDGVDPLLSQDPDGAGEVPTGWTCAPIGYGVEYCAPPPGDDGESPLGGPTTSGPTDAQFGDDVINEAGCEAGQSSAPGLMLVFAALALFLLTRRRQRA